MRRLNIINNIITLILTLGCIVLVAVQVYRLDYLFMLLGALVCAFIIPFIHEFGHVAFAKKNAFNVVSFKVWFMKWTKKSGKMVFDYCPIGSEAGATETYPLTSKNVEKRYSSVTKGGILFSGIFMLICIVPVIIGGSFSKSLFAFLGGFLPVAVYSFFNNALPIVNGGMLNDGATIYCIKKGDAIAKAVVGILNIHAELSKGLSFGQIDKSFYEELPVLPEDSPYYAISLMLKYSYFVDVKDFANAKDITNRLNALSKYLPKEILNKIKAINLYNACTFDKSEYNADQLMYELEKYLDGKNDAENIRIKMAYLVYIRGETEDALDFYEKGIEEAEKCLLAGEGVYEAELLNRIKNDLALIEQEIEE